MHSRKCFVLGVENMEILMFLEEGVGILIKQNDLCFLCSIDNGLILLSLLSWSHRAVFVKIMGKLSSLSIFHVPNFIFLLGKPKMKTDNFQGLLTVQIWALSGCAVTCAAKH